MAIHRNTNDLCVESVSECLESAKLLIDHRKSDGGIMGYAATLLLMSVVDAIGHHLNVGSGHTRLEVLNAPQFGLGLTPKQIYEVKQWYRNPLVHNASIVPNVYIRAEGQGPIFEFANSKPTMIRVVQFYKVVQVAWSNLNPTNFEPVKDTVSARKYTAPPASSPADIASMTSYSAPASGVI